VTPRWRNVLGPRSQLAQAHFPKPSREGRQQRWSNGTDNAAPNEQASRHVKPHLTRAPSAHKIAVPEEALHDEWARTVMCARDPAIGASRELHVGLRWATRAE
jgi:hypothetical protein